MRASSRALVRARASRDCPRTSDLIERNVALLQRDLLYQPLREHVRPVDRMRRRTVRRLHIT
jgi:hypothetical protein